MLAASFPVFILASKKIKEESSGPVFFSHERIGLHGKHFKVYKFRSMNEGSEQIEASLSDDELELYYKEFRLDNDPRVTETGRFLRRTYLDELPQLFNILSGNMSLVGPRPITEQELALYSGDERERLLSVKPGLTGFWQVFGRNKATYQNGERIRMELFYADHPSLALDLIIFLLTPASALSSVMKKLKETER